MTTTITNYTTYDLEYYYADLKRLSRLSHKERQRLVTGILGAQVSPAMPQETQVKHQLIEGYLPFAKHLAITLCPPTLYHRLLPDLIGAVNLAVVEATMRCDLGSTLSLDAYIAAYVRGAIKQTIVRDDLLNIPFRARGRARAEGTLEYLYAQYRVASLDELMAWFETDEVEESPLKPILPIEAAPLRDPQQRAQVETLLSYLSPRAQAILHLRYGLSDDNERRHTTKEIVCLPQQLHDHTRAGSLDAARLSRPASARRYHHGTLPGKRSWDERRSCADVPAPAPHRDAQRGESKATREEA